MYPAPIMPTLILVIKYSLSCNSCVLRQVERIPFPVLRPEDLNARNFVVANLPKGRDQLAQRQNTKTGQQPVLVEQRLARQIFGVVDVKDIDQVWVQRLDHFDRRAAGIKVETIDHESEVRTICGAYDLVSQVECGHAAIGLTEKLEGQRDVMARGDLAEFGQHADRFSDHFRSRGAG